MRCLGLPDELKQRCRVIGGEPCVAYGQCEKRDKRLRFSLDIMLLCVRWYVAYALSLRNLEEMMQERGLFVDHSTIQRWVIKLVPVLQEAFRKRKRKRGIGAMGKSWRLDETYIKIRGQDRY